MARIPLVTRDQIVEKDKPAYDAFMRSRANRPNIGPYSLLLHMPEMAQRVEALRTYLRDEASLPQKLQELVMISVARGFISYAHAGRHSMPIRAAWDHDFDESDRLLCGVGVQHEHLRPGGPSACDGTGLELRRRRRP